MRRSAPLLVAMVFVAYLSSGCGGEPPTAPPPPPPPDHSVLKGEIVYSSDQFGASELMAVRPDGSERRRLTTDGRGYLAPDISPDGRRIAFVRPENGRFVVYVMNADGSGVIQLVERSSFDGSPAWSPDGAQIAFRSENPGPFGSYGRIFLVNVDGTGLHQLTPEVSPGDYVYDDGARWSPDGSRILFTRNGALHVINRDGTGLASLTPLATDDRSWYPDWSPDGSHIAYGSLSASQNLRVRNADGSNPTTLTTGSAQENNPKWSPDSRRLVFCRAVNGVFQLFVINADGTGEHRLSGSAASECPASWSRVQ